MPLYQLRLLINTPVSSSHFSSLCSLKHLFLQTTMTSFCLLFHHYRIVPQVCAFPGIKTVSQPKYENTHPFCSVVIATSCSLRLSHPRGKEGREKKTLRVKGAGRSSSRTCWGKVLSERLAGQSGVLSAEENWKNCDFFFFFFKLCIK